MNVTQGCAKRLQPILPNDLRAVVEPHMHELGRLAGTRLDDLARIADRHPPVLHPRDAAGRDLERIEYHPAYQEMERIGLPPQKWRAFLIDSTNQRSNNGYQKRQQATGFR